MLRHPGWIAGALFLVLAGCETGGEPGCGDGEPVIPEMCDDGNFEDGDGCSATCEIEFGWTCSGEPSVCERDTEVLCGDGTVDEGEECDPGELTGDCDEDCTFAVCGDGTLNPRRGETCDDGNTEDGDGCSSMCMEEPDGCGDGVCTEDETCTGCPADCADEPRCEVCLDMDGDGFADSACGGEDCNDFDTMVNPDGTEVPCNRIDEDCDPATPDALDEDGDESSCNFDCDDSDPARSPLFFERCGNGIDDDCNPDTPDVLDRDGDGFLCDAECNDFDADVCPDCPEICDNEIDDDCNPDTPDVFDGDSDGATCDVDCDDEDSSAYPGNVEVCANGVDDDCDSSTDDLFDTDADGDTCDTDCDDTDPRRATTFSETCGNLIDDDCDAATPDLEDADSDGFTCDVDCADMDDTIVPDASGFCGPRIMYFEDFDSGDGGWTSSGTASSWAYGTPAGTFIDAAASGSGAWVTNLSGEYNASELSYLESPAFDFSTALVDPILSFSHIFETESCCDEGWVEISTDGGSTWNKLGRAGEGTNWYDDDFNDWWDGDSGSAGDWRQARIVLSGTAGEADVRLRFVMQSDGSVQDEGFGVDDVQIDNQIVDLALVSIGVPPETCARATHPVALTVRNNGSVPATGFDVAFSVDGGAEVTETVSDVVLPGSEHTYVFTATADLSAAGSHPVTGRVTASMDVDPGNDSDALVVQVDDVPIIPLGSGYGEGFETDDGGWTGTGSWAHGTPSGTFIDAAGEGTQAWVTNLSGDYSSSEDATLTSVCFDMSAVSSDPTLSFAHIFETESCCDEGWVEIYTSETGGFVRLGESGTGTNWYNDGSNRWWDGDSGSAGAWRTASHPLTGAAGQSLVRVRFVLQTDASVTREGFGVDDVSITP
ncbi:MAG TPA: MopE-related protein [Sandaracinaceae bacterium LLY-WYZ-13_1]|nr:MopE-related protein [Sandaracinaceae bacterium LLY-WYZ-13_1]